MLCVAAWVWFCLSTECVAKTGVGTTGPFLCSNALPPVLQGKNRRRRSEPNLAGFAEEIGGADPTGDESVDSLKVPCALN